MNIHSLVSVFGWIWKCNVPWTIHNCAGLSWMKQYSSHQASVMTTSHICKKIKHVTESYKILHLCSIWVYISWQNHIPRCAICGRFMICIITPARHVNIADEQTVCLCMLMCLRGIEVCSRTLWKGWAGSFGGRENQSLGEGELWLWHLLLQSTSVRLFAHITVHLSQNGEQIYSPTWTQDRETHNQRPNWCPQSNLDN